MTLIELLAGLVILGTLVGSVLVARSRYLHQLAQAQRVLEATVAADRLLETWWNHRQQLPLASSGTIEHAEQLLWCIQEREPAAEDLAGTSIVTVQVLDGRMPQGTAPLVTVELLLPPRPQTPQSQAKASEPSK